ncbi:helix-turn-helix transcriptional regulator [Streptomyces carpaticus]|uniref:Helix-turn-helix transcriptional regulator n=1 Tax=Streptomyces carpaticus TaxID=285558 RepID=A0ABV4ZRM7_9ACTN
MTGSTELGAFLRSRRAQLQPREAGLGGGVATRRRVPGLRREELALLAGVSKAYYTRLEQGQCMTASPSVLDALARALGLDEAERAHLHDLARPARGCGRMTHTESAHPRMRQLLSAVGTAPALVLGRRHEVLAWNRMGHALLAGHLEPDSPRTAGRRPSLPRMLFLDQHTRELYADWADEVRKCVAYLRLVAGRYPDDQQLASLIGELSMKSREFAEQWGRRQVRDCTFGTKHFHHPLVGPLSLDYEMLRLPDRPDQQLALYSAVPGSPAQTALSLLADLMHEEDQRSHHWSG